MNPVGREMLTQTLLDTYFKDTASKWTRDVYGSIATKIEHEILDRPGIQYKLHLDEMEHKLDRESYQEELYVRSGIFKRTIPRIYKNTCAISGMRVIATTEAQMVDACHIVPFSVSKDDTITNGICLSPNLHRAFDRGLITIDSDYRVRISSSISEADSPFSLHQFANKPIVLPDHPLHLPLKEHLEWHGREVFVG
jgi:putative restriction endonuclease